MLRKASLSISLCYHFATKRRIWLETVRKYLYIESCLFLRKTTTKIFSRVYSFTSEICKLLVVFSGKRRLQKN